MGTSGSQTCWRRCPRTRSPRVLYRRHGSEADLRESTRDAIDLAVEGVLRRIRRRVSALESGHPDAIYELEDDDDD